MDEGRASGLWQRLRAAGVVHGDPPLLPEDDGGTPWPVRWLAGAGAWIAVPALLAFMALAFRWQPDDWAALLVSGLLLTGASLPVLRLAAAGEFVRQSATVANLCGLLVTGTAIGWAADDNSRVMALATALLGAALFVLSRSWVHRFLCANAVAACLVWLMLEVGRPAPGTSMARLLMVWLTVAAWLLRLYGDPATWPRRMIEPAAWAFTVVLLVLAWLLPLLDLPGRTQEFASVRGVHLAAASALPVVAAALILPHCRAIGATASAGLLLTALLLAWLWRWVPGAPVALALLLLAVAMGATVLMLVAIAFFAVALAHYYWQLTDSLLAKSLSLAIGGTIILAVHLVLRARRRREGT